MAAYLTFELNRLTYALAAVAVREIFPLPELVPVAEAPGDIIGLLDLRGKILPVMHLAKRLGQDCPPCQTSDRVVVLEWQGLQIGMVVHAVRDAIDLDPAAIATEPDYGRVSDLHTRFVGGVVTVGETLTVVLDPDTLIRDAVDVAVLAIDGPSDADFGAPTDFYDRYFPNTTDAERQLLRDRALALQPTVDEGDLGASEELVATFRLGSEFFGIDVGHVREFLRLPEAVPIPCCPPHILGNANLRGEILTLIDVRAALNLPSDNRAELTQAIVIEVGEIVAGIATGEVFDVRPLPASALQEAPTTGQAHLRGMATFGDLAVGVLDLPELLERGGLSVNETVA